MFNEICLIGKFSEKPILVELDGRKAVKVSMDVIHDDDHDIIDNIISYYYCDTNILSQCEKDMSVGIFGHAETINNSTQIIIDVFQLN